MGLSREGRVASSIGSPTITLVATLMKSTPMVLDTKGKERDALKLHSITYDTTLLLKYDLNRCRQMQSC